MKYIKFCLIIFAYFSLLHCGIEDYPFINPIPQANITQTMNNRAVIRVPDDYEGSPFSHFAIFYRIYVSDIPQASTTSANSYPTINPVLSSDYNSFRTYIDSTTHVNVDMQSLFQGRGYKYLALMGHNINNVLSSDAFGSTITFDFSSLKMPTMALGGTTYTLWRSDGFGLFSPLPNRNFVNSEELWKSENINSTINADVVNKSDINERDRHYTYAAMFIVAVGVNVSTGYSEIYSTPSLIHVFQLPDQW